MERPITVGAFHWWHLGSSCAGFLVARSTALLDGVSAVLESAYLVKVSAGDRYQPRHGEEKRARMGMGMGMIEADELLVG